MMWEKIVKLVSDKSEESEVEFRTIDSEEAENLKLEDVKIIATAFSLSQNWQHLEATNIQLVIEKASGLLFWDVDFILKGMDDDLYQGTRGFIRISDISGEIVKKSFVPY